MNVAAMDGKRNFIKSHYHIKIDSKESVCVEGGRTCIPILTVLGSCDSCCYLLFYSQSEENPVSSRVVVVTMKTTLK